MWPFTKRGHSEPPRLPDSPNWMVVEVHRRTGKPLDECRRILTAPTLEQYWELTGDGPSDGFERRDPIELDPALAPALLRATLEAEQEAGSSGDYGYCFVLWDCKKRILRKRYGVKWQDPAELNAGNDYD